jgi:hypothetical protein
MKKVHSILALVVLLLVLTPPVSQARATSQGCSIEVTVLPPVVNFPSGALPSPSGIAFGEIVDVNYTASLVNQTITFQYWNGSQWLYLSSVTGNVAQFTEVDYGLNSAWAKFGTNAIRAQGNNCVSNVADFVVVQDSGAPLVDLGAYSLLVALIALFFLTGKWLGWGRFIFVAAAVYLAISPFTGQRYDVYFLLSSGIRVLQHVNPFDPGNPPAYPSPLKWAYPPAYAVYSALSFLIYQLTTGAYLPSVSALTWPGWLTSTYNVFLAYVPQTLPVLVFLLKLPMVASALLTGWLLRRMTGKELAAISWLTNPLVILVAAVWGQLDPIATLFAVASMYYFQRGKEYHAYLLSSIGAAVKVWPVILIPIMLVVSLRRNGGRALKPLAAVLPAALVTVGLYAAFANPLESLYVLIYARGIPTFAGAFSVNGLTWQQILAVMNSPPVPLFLYLGIPLYILMLSWIYWKRDDDVVKWVVVSILIFFLTYNYVNPQYFYWMLPFLLLQKRRFQYLLFTALPFAVLAPTYNIFYFVSPSVLPNEFAYGASIVEQLKVNVVYQTTWLFVLLLGIIPTVCYLGLLVSEVRPGKVRGLLRALGFPEGEQGLVSQPVEGGDARDKRLESLQD